jgi:hypothetical protein
MPSKLSFEAWKTKVDAWISQLCGLDSESLPDVDYYAWYTEGCSAKIAAYRAIRNAKQV